MSTTSSFVQSAHRQYGVANEGFSQYVIERTRTCIVNVSSLRDHLRNALDGWSSSAAQQNQGEINALEHYETLLFELLGLLRRIGQQWQVYLDQLDVQAASTSYQVSSVSSGRRGRPRFDITADQIIYLHSLSFLWKKISSLLGVSRMTIYRRRVQYGLVHPAYQTLTDAQLQATVREIHSQQPTLGEVMVWGRIRARGFHVTRQRLRRAIRTTDPLHTALRWRGDLTPRHPYSVAGPNSLWHIGE